MTRRFLIFILLSSVFENVLAETVLPSSFSYYGYLDTSYNYLLRKNVFTSGTQDRVFDLDQNGFTLHQLGVTLSNQPQHGFGGVLDIFVGRDAHTLAAYGFDPDIGLSQNLGFYATQAFLQYAISSWTFSAGQQLSVAGYEVDKSIQDTNFSRGILGYIQPGSVLGLRALYTVNDQLNFTGGINNGWDNIRDASRGKTFELNAVYNPNAMFSFNFGLYSGEERAVKNTSGGPVGRRSLFDFFVIANATEKVMLVMNYDYMIQSKSQTSSGEIAKALVQGIAGYFNYKFNDKWRTSLRGEFLSDANGFATGVQQNWREITLTFGYAPFKNFELRAETRRDFTSTNSFVDTNGVSVSNNNQSFGLEAVYQFL